jgi:hypothetical protein
VSVKDRWVGPREQVLNVSITCRRYGPGMPNSRLSIEACLFPTALLAVMGEKLGTGLRTGQSTCCELGREPFFLGAVDFFSNLLTTTRKVAMCWPCEIRMVWDHMQNECGMRVVCWSGFPYKVYIDLNRRDSQIWVTACLWPSAHRELNGMDNGLIWNCFTLSTCLITLDWPSSGLSCLKFN